MPAVRRARWSPQWVAAIVAASMLVILGVLGRLTGAESADFASIGSMNAVAALFTAMGALVLSYVPGHLVGRLLVAAGGAAIVEVVALDLSGWLPLAWLSQWAWWPPLALTFIALLVFPDGHLASGRWRVLAGVLVLSATATAVALAIAAVDYPRTLVTSMPSGYPARTQLLLDVAAAAGAIGLLSLFGVLWSLWLRWRHAQADRRQQLSCVLAGVFLLVLGLGLDIANVPGGWALYTLALPLAMTVAVLRYHLYGLDRVINRGLVWLLMTVVVIVGFVGVVAIVRGLVPEHGSSWPSLIATGLVAVTFEPLRNRVQHGVNHLLYGDRDDPYKVVTQLGDLLEHTADSTAVLPSLTRSIASSLQVPYVAIETQGRHGVHVVARHGTPAGSEDSFEMLTHSQQVGRLVVGHRTSGGHFTPPECRLLQNVAQHAAVAAEATGLISDLQESRERLIVAQEEERRRLRRDLHDGVGPSLAGMSMQVRAARKVVAGQQRVEQILAGLDEDLRRCNAEMRVLVDRLRPPALDRGLDAGLRAECARFDGPGLSVRLDVSGSLEGLPAAVEVVAYRILSEALTNVSRHSGAHHCQVTVARGDRDLLMTIRDDGVGFTPHQGRGVGLGSMQERAEELGGECGITGTQGSGATVEARLPVTAAGGGLAVAPDAATERMESGEQHGAEPADPHRGRPSGGAARAALDAGG